MKKVNYKEIVNLLNSSDIEIIKLGVSYLLDLNLINEKTFQNIFDIPSIYNFNISFRRK